MSGSVTLHQLDAASFDRACAALAALHPVDESTLRAVFTDLGADFDAYWRGARAAATDLATNDRDAVRKVLRDAVPAIAGRRSWKFDGGLAAAVHAIVGVDPKGLGDLYRLSGGPPRPRRGGGIIGPAELAEVVDGAAQVDEGFDRALPDRFAPEPGEPGIVGAWSAAALEDVLPAMRSARDRSRVDAALRKREASKWGRLTGDARRAAEIRASLDAGLWTEWARLVEAVEAATASDGLLGCEAR